MAFSLAWTPVEEIGGGNKILFNGFAHEKLRVGKFNKVPILIGFNSQEILLFGK